MANTNWAFGHATKRVLISGNEAVARGALEAGVRVVSSYPGSPSVQIVESLADVAREKGLYVEWSVNEKVALEVAAAASMAEVRSLCVMKADGLNVALDFLAPLCLDGVRHGLVLAVSDDPGAHSSPKEEDTRYLGPAVHAPVVEPSSPEEARQMTSWAFEVSQSVSLPMIVRLVTRICHARGVVQLGEEPEGATPPSFPPGRQHFSAGVWHQRTHDRLDSLQEIYDNAPFNRYMGPANPELTIFCSGVSFFYAQEAVERLNLAERVGILKIGTIWPLPRRLVLDRLSTTARVLFIEEFEPFLEDQTRILAAQYGAKIGAVEFMGRDSGFVPYVMKTRGMGEMDPDIATDALSRAMNVRHRVFSPGFKAKLEALPDIKLPPRPPALCAGCAHRASFWEIKTALSLDERDGFILGDIGCYALGRGETGFFSVRTVFAMGSGLGLASGMGKLSELGMEQPAVAIVGDSTFYHAGIPPLINAKMNQSNVLAIVLDNSTTAMTGHQPHPGSGKSAMGEESKPISLEALIEGLGIEVTVADPYEVDRTIKTIEDLLQQTGPRVLILRRGCALLEAKEMKGRRVRVDQQRCLGSECGCNRLCMRVFSCPGNIWDDQADRALIDDVACVGCGVCAQLCPHGAILIEENEEADHGA